MPERVELQQVFERHRLRHLEHPPQLLGAIADLRAGRAARRAARGVGASRKRIALGRNSRSSSSGSPSRCSTVRKNAGRLGHPRREPRRRRPRRGRAERPREPACRPRSSRRCRTARASRGRLDVRVLRRQEVQHVGVEAQAGGERRAHRHDQEESDEDQPVAPAGEENQTLERSAGAQAITGGCGGAGGGGLAEQRPVAASSGRSTRSPSRA